MEALYAEAGLDLNEILELPEREDFKQAASVYFNQLVPSIPASRSGSGRTLEAERLAYAGKMAEWSQSKNQKVDLKKEMLYMYISHYIDVQNPLDAFHGIDKNSLNENILAKYITDYDRKSYDIYVSKGTAKQAAQAVTSAVLLVSQSSGGVTDALSFLRGNRNKFAGVLRLGADFLITVDDIDALKKTFSFCYNRGESVEDTIAMLENQLESFNKPLMDSKNVAKQFVGFMLGPKLAAVPLAAFSLYTELGFNLLNITNYYSLRLYYNFRWSDRVDFAYGPIF